MGHLAFDINLSPIIFIFFFLKTEAFQNCGQPSSAGAINGFTVAPGVSTLYGPARVIQVRTAGVPPLPFKAALFFQLLRSYLQSSNPRWQEKISPDVRVGRMVAAGSWQKGPGSGKTAPAACGPTGKKRTLTRRAAGAVGARSLLLTPSSHSAPRARQRALPPSARVNTLACSQTAACRR